MNQHIVDAFWSRVTKTDSCWNWTGYCNKEGHGSLECSRGNQLMASHISWHIHFGEPIPIRVWNICGNPACVCPTHITGRKPCSIEIVTARFWKRVNKTETCWLWTGTTPGFGYGKIKTADSYVGTHRFSWMIHFGDIPEGMQVCHKCDVPACVRPDHLFLGTTQDNMADKFAKGRHASGEDHGTSKLTWAKVLEIRKLSTGKHGEQVQLAKQFEVDRTTIGLIIHNKIWRDSPLETVL